MDPFGVGQIGNFFWWEGVVEDNLDPTGAGRCKVRVIAHNSPLKSDISTTELPWAYPMMPLNNPHGKIVSLKPGTRVTGFFRDGDVGQDLVMMGTINTGYGAALGFDESQPAVEAINIAEPVPRVGITGFIDDRAGAGGPIENQPQKTRVIVDDSGNITHENISDYGPIVVNEINTPRLARGIEDGTVVAAHRQLQTSITKTDDTTIPEPETPFAALYPFNAVEESDSGHLREVDDTPGAERIKETHRTGTFYEIHPDGSRVTKVVKDDFSVTIGDKGVKVDGICAVHVVGEADFYCQSDIRVKTDMNAQIEVTQDADINVTGDTTARVGRDLSAIAEGRALITGESFVDVVSGGDMSIQAAGEITFADESATAANVDEIIKDTVDRKGNARIRVDSGA